MTHSPETPEARNPLAFCGKVPWRFISEFKDGEEVAACFVIREARKLQTRANQPYIKLVLGDRTGTIEGVIWEEIERWESVCVPKDVVGVRGTVSFYKEKPQLRITAIEKLSPSPGDLDHLLPISRRPRELMERELEAHIASVKDRGLRNLLRRCLGKDTTMGRAFREHPAATRNHHAYLHGLLEHTLSVAGSCIHLAEHYQGQGVQVDRDLLITGALLHDIGKTEELEGPPAPQYTTAGRLLGHIVIGIQRIGETGASIDGLTSERLLLVQHLIASHQGKPEWDSPRVPQILEGFILHYADDLDARLNQVTSALAETEPGEWSSYERSLGRSLYQPKESSRAGVNDPAFDDSVIDLFRG